MGYWVAKDGRLPGREYPEQPSTVSELYHRIAVKKMGAEDWIWNMNGSVLVPDVPLTINQIDTSCNCSACQYLKSARCTSDRCWYWKNMTNKQNYKNEVIFAIKHLKRISKAF